MSQKNYEYFTELQPKDGDLILHCDREHLGKGGHFFSLGDGAPFTRPDGTTGFAKWIAICDACFELHGSNPMAAVSGDSTFTGDDPIIKNVAN
jgi:hypothetical protein